MSENSRQDAMAERAEMNRLQTSVDARLLSSLPQIDSGKEFPGRSLAPRRRNRDDMDGGYDLSEGGQYDPGQVLGLNGIGYDGVKIYGTPYAFVNMFAGRPGQPTIEEEIANLKSRGVTVVNDAVYGPLALTDSAYGAVHGKQEEDGFSKFINFAIPFGVKAGLAFGGGQAASSLFGSGGSLSSLLPGASTSAGGEAAWGVNSRLSQGFDPLTMGETVNPFTTDPSFADLTGGAFPEAAVGGGGLARAAAGAGAAGLAANTLGGSSQEIDGSAQSIYDANARAGVDGFDPDLVSGVSGVGTDPGTLTNTGGSAAKTALSKFLSGEGSLEDYLKIAGGLGSTALGVFGAMDQSNAIREANDKNAAAFAAAQERAMATLTEAQKAALLSSGAGRDAAIAAYNSSLQQALAASGTARTSALDANQATQDQYFALGAPSRARFEGSFDPGFTMANDPGFTDALNQSAKATLHGLSVQGNPAGNPNAWATSLQDLYQKNAYPALTTYRNTNFTAGQSGLGTAGSASLARPGIYGDFGKFDASLIDKTGSNVANANLTTGQNDSNLIGNLGKAGAQVQAGTYNTVPNSNSGVYNALGSGLSSLTNPQQDYNGVLAKLLQQFQLSGARA